MQYILITPTGRLYVFDVLECAEIYKNAFGGTLIAEVLQTTTCKDSTHIPA